VADLSQRPGLRLLYLDNDEDQVFLTRIALERLGCRVSGFVDAGEALAAVRRSPDRFDVFVTDLHMPLRSGLEVASELAELHPHLPVIVVSGAVSDTMRSGAARAGVRHLIERPPVPQDLLAAIERALQSAREGA
jgi:DNA-binding NtrC family response regulator